MVRGIRAASVAGVLAAASLTLYAQAPSSQSAQIQRQLGEEFLVEGRYQDALDAFQRALTIAEPDDVRAVRAGLVQSALRVAEFDLARAEAEKLVAAAPKSPDAVALYADALWASGLFEEAETRYRDTLAVAPDLARGHHGMASALAVRSRLRDAMDGGQAALRLWTCQLRILHIDQRVY